MDDEPANLESLERILRSEGAAVRTFTDPKVALTEARRGNVDIVITDLRMGSMSGMELLAAIKAVDPTVEVILITAYGTVDIAVEAMKKGANDFITKPLQRLHVLRAVHLAGERRRLVNENVTLKDELRTHSSDREMIGRSPALKQMMETATQAARSRANVLIEGESGTGKGVLAEYLHRASGLPGLCVKINCTAVPDNLLEAELFGYEPGAFTGAAKRKKGRVELADGGTLFLDEIGIAPPALQAKLLRFVQDGEFERLGGIETLHVQTRVISATNADLKTAILKGTMREDLFYRLNVVHIRVPPLRERREDVPLLVQQFLEESAKKNGRPAPLVHSDALDALVAYSWPGNIRELENLMERLVVLNRNGVVERSDLPSEMGGGQRPRTIVVPIGCPLRDVEKLLMEETLKSTKGDKKLAARLLGVHPRTIYRYLENDGEAKAVQNEEPLG